MDLVQLGHHNRLTLHEFRTVPLHRVVYNQTARAAGSESRGDEIAKS